MTIEETIKQHITDICEKTGAEKPITVFSAFNMLCEHLGEDKAVELYKSAVKETKHNIFRWSAFQATLDVYYKNKTT